MWFIFVSCELALVLGLAPAEVIDDPTLSSLLSPAPEVGKPCGIEDATATSTDLPSPAGGNQKEPVTKKRKPEPSPEIAVEAQTPGKKAREEAQETPEKPGAFGGKQAKALCCQVCEHQRDQSQRGATCDFCFQKTRQLLGHQRISEILQDETLKAKIREKSLAERAQLEAEPKEKKPSLDHKALGKLVKQLERVLVHLPRLEALADRLEKL